MTIQMDLTLYETNWRVITGTISNYVESGHEP
jgi:hypothetical protein